jgi:hypothetical protein
MKKISTSSTKNEILEAYDEILNYFNDQKEENSTLKKDLADKIKQVSTAKSIVSNANPTETLDVLRDTFVKHIDDVKSKILEEKRKFEQIEEAIKIEKETLENIYQIKVQSKSLEALIMTNKQAKEKLEADIKETKEKFDLETKIAKEKFDLEMTTSKLNRQREEDDFMYNLKIKRRNEADIYLQKSNKLEQDLKDKQEFFDKEVSERSNELKQKEDEFKTLLQQSKEYEKNISQAISQTEKEVTEKIKREFEFKQQLDNKELEVQIKLLQQEIDLFKSKVKEQQVIINELNEKATKASDQVKDIALKAIEGAATTRWSSEKNREETSNKN